MNNSVRFPSVSVKDPEDVFRDYITETLCIDKCMIEPIIAKAKDTIGASNYLRGYSLGSLETKELKDTLANLTGNFKNSFKVDTTFKF